ncbi:caspase family protein [Rhizobium leguminosarum]|uniref:caspase family protein n=1 Tax=Rhizobium leguminosarum TaxID=384 RepID=UPI003F9588C7
MLFRAILVSIFSLLAGAAAAETKVALLIANANYTSVAALKNPPNDIAVMRETLEAAGFDVSTLENGTRAKMSAALASFEEKVADADIGLVYYSGHGVEVNGENFLIPVDAALRSDRDVKYEAIVLSDVIGALSKARSFKLVLLDACRDNPFLRTMKHGLTKGGPARGLARVDSSESNMLIGYATAPGDVATDGDGATSPYAQALARHIASPGLEIEAAMRAVAKDVFQATGGRQRPFKTGSLFDTVMLSPSKTTSVPEEDVCRDAAIHWAETSKSAERSLFEDHLKNFPNCAFASLARMRLASLTPDQRTGHATIVIPSAPIHGSEDDAPQTDCDLFASASDDKMKVASVDGVAFPDIATGQALEACQAAVDQYPRTARLWYQLGRSLHKAGEYAKASEAYIVAWNYGSAAAMNGLGQLLALLAREGKTEEFLPVLIWFQEHITKDRASSATELGGVFEEKAQLGRAVAMYTLAAKFDEPNALYKLSWFSDRGAFGASDPKLAATYMIRSLKSGLLTGFQSDIWYGTPRITEEGQWSFQFRVALQEEMISAGVYSGKVDGRLGSSTVKAVEKLRKKP